MLLPFQYSVIAVEDARIMMKYIETSTATKGNSRCYDKMSKAGVLDIYKKLREFVEFSEHYENNLRNFDPNDFARDDNY